MDGSLSISACSSPAPVSAQLPSGFLEERVQPLVHGRRVPPIASNSPARLCGTIHVYCALLPSANPSPVDGVEPGPGAVVVAVLDVAAVLGVEDVLPVLRPREELLVRRLVAGPLRELSQCEVGGGVLERLDRTAPGVGLGGDVVQRQVLVERRPLADRHDRLAGRAEVLRGRYGRGLAPATCRRRGRRSSCRRTRRCRPRLVRTGRRSSPRYCRRRGSSGPRRRRSGRPG